MDEEIAQSELSMKTGVTHSGTVSTSFQSDARTGAEHLTEDLDETADPKSQN